MKAVKVKNLIFGKGMPKICIPIVEKEQTEIERIARYILSEPADLVEWRVDCFQDAENPEKVQNVLKSLREILGPMPILFTFRTKKEGGSCEITREEYRRLLLLAASTKYADLLDVELSAGEVLGEIVEKVHRYGGKVILSHHDFEKTPSVSEMKSYLGRMEVLGGDLVKLAVMPDTEEDVFKLLEVSYEWKRSGKQPAVTMAMGRMGAISRMAGEFFGSAITFGTAGRASAPGQIPCRNLKEILNGYHEFSAGKENLYLIGFMGAGKTTVAGRLKERRKIGMVEMDQEIQKEQQMTVSEIFERFGEEAFREMETELLKRCAKKRGLIVSCGGGTALREENVRIMKESGIVIWLTVLPETVRQRVETEEDRPLLKGKKSLEEIGRLMEKRRKYYDRAADYAIETDGKSVEELCAEIEMVTKMENDGKI